MKEDAETIWLNSWQKIRATLERWQRARTDKFMIARSYKTYIKDLWIGHVSQPFFPYSQI